MCLTCMHRFLKGLGCTNINKEKPSAVPEKIWPLESRQVAIGTFRLEVEEMSFLGHPPLCRTFKWQLLKKREPWKPNPGLVSGKWIDIVVPRCCFLSLTKNDTHMRQGLRWDELRSKFIKGKWINQQQKWYDDSSNMSRILDIPNLFK